MTTPQSTTFLHCKAAKDLNTFSTNILCIGFVQYESKGRSITLVYKPKMKISSISTLNPMQRSLPCLLWEFGIKKKKSLTPNQTFPISFLI